MKALLFVLMTISSLSFAQEHLAVRLNEKGLMKVMQLAIKYNTAVNNSRTVIVPQNLYSFSIKQRDLIDNPIVNTVNDISNLNLNKDLRFYLHTSDIKVNGKVDPKSLKTVISNSGPNGFDLKISINLNQVVVNASSMSLCEDRQNKYKKCGSGLKTTISGLKIVTYNRPVVLSSTMRLTINKGVATVKVLRVNSNLEGNTPPSLDIDFAKVVVPRIAIVINNQETELDTSKLRSEILERKTYLGRKLLAFAGEFIASDLAEMINVYLANTRINTTFQLYQRDAKPVTFGEFNYGNPFAQDNTYVRPSVRIGSIPQKKPSYTNTDYSRFTPPTVARDNTYVKMPVILYQDLKPAKDVMQVMMDQFSSVIRHAQVDLSLKSIKTPANKDVELAGILNFVLNHSRFTVRNTIANSSRTLPKLDLSAYRAHDINLAISEPVINGALDLVSSTGLFQELLEEVSDVDGLSVKNLKFHIASSNSLKVIANIAIDLKQIRTSFWNDPRGWAETEVGTWLERNNNNSVIYFPLEIGVIPVFAKDASGAATLSIKIKSPFSGTSLLNTYKYPSNVVKMTDTVRQGVLKKLRGQLDQFADKTFNIDLSKFLNQSGVLFQPKSISFNQSAYLLLNLDIKDIKFNSKNPTKK